MDHEGVEATMIYIPLDGKRLSIAKRMQSSAKPGMALLGQPEDHAVTRVLLHGDMLSLYNSVQFMTHPHFNIVLVRVLNSFYSSMVHKANSVFSIKHRPSIIRHPFLLSSSSLQSKRTCGSGRLVLVHAQSTLYFVTPAAIYQLSPMQIEG